MKLVKVQSACRYVRTWRPPLAAGDERSGSPKEKLASILMASLSGFRFSRH